MTLDFLLPLPRPINHIDIQGISTFFVLAHHQNRCGALNLINKLEKFGLAPEEFGWAG